MELQIDIANALGFDTVEQMELHQIWLNEQKKHGELARQAVQDSLTTGVIDLRTVFPSLKTA